MKKDDYLIIDEPSLAHKDCQDFIFGVAVAGLTAGMVAFGMAALALALIAQRF